MTPLRVLVVDDEPGMLEVCSDVLRRLPGTEILLENQGPRAAARLDAEAFDLLILDLRMPELDGVAILRLARQKDPELSVLMFTAFPSVETAVECMKLGAADYLTKPFLPEDLLASVGRLLEERRLRLENQLLQRHAERAYRLDEMVGQSVAMQAVFKCILQAAESGVDVLIFGETGTGKELVAHSIHMRSRRKEARFVPVDCGAIPEHLLESELFGHERGAFTGAHRQSLGLLEYADGGTFFLDEVAELPLSLQAKLLRSLQERKFRRVGGVQEIAVDVRVVAATNRDLQAELRERRFREDLFYRLNVVRINLPPLRERAEDIPLLAQHFLTRYAREMGKEKAALDPEAVEILSGYSWPGNVRELQNVLKRTLAMTRHDTILSDDLPDEVVIQAERRESLGAPGAGFFQMRAQRLAAFEKEYLTDLLRAHQGEAASAARDAHMPRGTLYRLLKKHELKPEEFRGS